MALLRIKQPNGEWVEILSIKGEKGDPGDVNKSYVDSTFANALKGTVTGGVVHVDDVNPIDHELNVTVDRANLIRYPYRETTKTVNGLTFTDNGDGSITINGTATAGTQMTLSQSNWVLPAGDYYYSGGENIEKIVRMEIRPLNGSGNSYPVAPSFVKLATDSYVTPYLYVKEGETANNLTVYPMLNKGTTALPYAPYVSDLSVVTVSRVGKNLIPFPYESSSTTRHGLTITVHDDGSITVNGTATADTQFVVVSQFGVGRSRALIANTNYFLSGCPNVAGCSIRLDELSGAAVSQMDSGNGKSFATSFPNRNCCLYIENGTTVNNAVFKPQLEFGTAATDYEVWCEPQKVKATVDGAVQGLVSVSKSTTLFADPVGVVIDCQYNRDINKAFAELQQAIISLGGNV